LVFEKIDDYTVRFTYNEPATLFLTALANQDGADRTYAAFLPAHYLKKFHPAYTSKEEIDRQVQTAGFKTWTELFAAKNAPPENPERPTMAGWSRARCWGAPRSRMGVTSLGAARLIAFTLSKRLPTARDKLKAEVPIDGGSARLSRHFGCTERVTRRVSRKPTPSCGHRPHRHEPVWLEWTPTTGGPRLEHRKAASSSGAGETPRFRLPMGSVAINFLLQRHLNEMKNHAQRPGNVGEYLKRLIGIGSEFDGPSSTKV
jgi:hypothetical protein